MGAQYFVEPLAVMQTDGTAITNTTTPSTLLHPSGLFSMDQNSYFVGKHIRIRATGRISTVVTTPGTFQFTLRHGATTVWDGGAMALNIVAKANVTWVLSIDLTCRAIGSGTSATLLGVGEFSSEAVIGSPLTSVGGSGVLLLPSSAPAVGTGFDSTAAQAVNLYGTWSIANASNSIQCHQFVAEAVN